MGSNFQAHSNYRSISPWYDWVMIWWEVNNPSKPSKMEQICDAGFGDDIKDKQRYKYAPGQILAFFHRFNGEHKALINICAFEPKQSSYFSTLWKQSYIYIYQLQQKKTNIQSQC